MRKILQKISHPFLKKFTSFYFSKPRMYSYKDLHVLVHQDVFPPHYTISTKILLDYLYDLELEGKNVLELGCGSGIISLLAASKGANVLASDINSNALKYLEEASISHNLSLDIVYSDLFSNIAHPSFDYIIINPPYYPKTPKNVKELAWFCGEDFNYFKELFQQLEERSKDKNILMILSEDCQIDKIKEIAFEHDFIFECILEKKVMQEKNFVFEISKIPANYQ